MLISGSPLVAGHYIAYVMDPSNDSWWKYDDKEVTKCYSLPFNSTFTFSTPRFASPWFPLLPLFLSLATNAESPYLLFYTKGTELRKYDKKVEAISVSADLQDEVGTLSLFFPTGRA